MKKDREVAIHHFLLELYELFMSYCSMNVIFSNLCREPCKMTNLLLQFGHITQSLMFKTIILQESGAGGTRMNRASQWI